MSFEELSKDKVEFIDLVMSEPPNFVNGSPWLSVYPCKPENMFDNQILLNKVVTAAILTSGAMIYSFDLIRKDGDVFDIDRYFLLTSGSIILRKKEISKNFPEHHSAELPYYYSN